MCWESWMRSSNKLLAPMTPFYLQWFGLLGLWSLLRTDLALTPSFARYVCSRSQASPRKRVSSMLLSEGKAMLMCGNLGSMKTIHLIMILLPRLLNPLVRLKSQVFSSLIITLFCLLALLRLARQSVLEAFSSVWRTQSIQWSWVWARKHLLARSELWFRTWNQRQRSLCFS